jgi:polysaccharide export outer membrane protein
MGEDKIVHRRGQATVSTSRPAAAAALEPPVAMTATRENDHRPMKTGHRPSSNPIRRAALLGLILALPAAAVATTPPEEPRASQDESVRDEAEAVAEVAPPLPVEEERSPSGDAETTAPTASEPTAPTGAAAGAAAVTGSEYLVRPGDTLRITVWKEPEMSGDATVRPDGKVTVPLLGDVNAWLRTPRQLSGTIAEGLARFVEEPQVTVAILQANSARFFIIGQVVKPGVYPLAGQISVLQAIALSGGFTPFAKRNKMRLFRGVDGSEGVTQIDFEKLSAGDIRQNFVLQPGDTLVVP